MEDIDIYQKDIDIFWNTIQQQQNYKEESMNRTCPFLESNRITSAPVLSIPAAPINCDCHMRRDNRHYNLGQYLGGEGDVIRTSEIVGKWILRNLSFLWQILCDKHDLYGEERTFILYMITSQKKNSWSSLLSETFLPQNHI